MKQKTFQIRTLFRIIIQYTIRDFIIELNSKLIKPSEAIANEFLKIVKSIEFTKPEANNFSTETGFKKFLNEYEDILFPIRVLGAEKYVHGHQFRQVFHSMS